MASLAFDINSNRSKSDRPACLIVGDVLLYREGLAAGLSRLGNIQVADSIHSKDAARSISELAPDVVVLDISHPDTLDAMRHLLHDQPDIPILGFGVGGQHDAMRCAEVGISSFVGRDESLENLERAIKKAARGEAVCSPSLTARLIRHMASLVDNAQVQTSNCLTDREREVAMLVKRGMSNKEIAIELGISPATVKNHVHMILEKLNMPRRAAIGMAL